MTAETQPVVLQSELRLLKTIESLTNESQTETGIAETRTMELQNEPPLLKSAATQPEESPTQVLESLEVAAEVPQGFTIVSHKASRKVNSNEENVSLSMEWLQDLSFEILSPPCRVDCCGHVSAQFAKGGE